MNNARIWKSNVPEPKTVLLSGGPALLHGRIDPIDLLNGDGSIIGALQAFDGKSELEAAGLFAERVSELRPMMLQVARSVLLSPRLGEAYDEETDTIPEDWLTNTDLLMIFSEAFGGLSDQVARFPGEPTGNVPSAPGSEGIRTAALRAVGAAGSE